MIQVPQVFDDMGKYSEIKLTIGSGTISEINSHLVGYFKDFIGVFVGLISQNVGSGYISRILCYGKCLVLQDGISSVPPLLFFVTREVI